MAHRPPALHWRAVAFLGVLFVAAKIRETPMTRDFSISADATDFDAEFFVWDVTLGEPEVKETALAYVPSAYLQLIRQNVKAREVAPGAWLVTVHYASIDPQRAVGTTPTGGPQPPDPNGPTNGINGPKYGFETTGGTTHITQSRRTVSKTSNRGDETPDTGQAIGVSDTGVAGCDIHSPRLEITMEFPYPLVSLAYICALQCLTGTVNYKQKFAGFQEGEVLYLGATGNYTQNDAWVVTHRFGIAQNQPNVKIAAAIIPTTGAGGLPAAGGQITIPMVRGWDYVWVEYTTARVGPAPGRMLQIPSAAYVEEVYPTGNFCILPGGPPKLREILGEDANAPGFFQRMSEKVAEKVRLRNSSVQQVVGSVVGWTDPPTGSP